MATAADLFAAPPTPEPAKPPAKKAVSAAELFAAPEPEPTMPPGATAGAMVGGRLQQEKAWEETPELLRRPDAEPPELQPGPSAIPEYLQRPPGTPMSGLEEAGWTAAGVGVPTVLGIGSGIAGGPLAGAAIGGLSSAGIEHLRQEREKQLGLRDEVNPWTIGFEAGMGAIPGAPLEKLGLKTLAPKVAARVVEGSLMGGGSVAARKKLETGEWPTARELFTGAAVGGVTGGALGGGMEAVQHGVAGRIARAAERDANAPMLWLVTDKDGNYTTTSDERLAAKAHKQMGGDEAGASMRIMDLDETSQFRRWQAEQNFVGPPEPSPQGELFEPPEPQRMVTQPGETIGPTPEAQQAAQQQQAQARPAQEQAQTSAEGVPPPEAAAEGAVPPKPPEAPPPPPPEPEQLELGAEPTTHEAAESRAWAASPFRKVAGLYEAMTGKVIPPKRARPGERLSGELAGARRMWGHLPEDSQQILEYSILHSKDDIAEAARGEVPVETTRALAAELNVDPARMAKEPKGTIWNAERLEAAAMHIEGLMRRIDRLRTAYQADPLNGRAALDLQEAADELATVMVAYQGRKAEVGRALNIMKFRKRAFDSGDPAAIREASRVGGTPEEIALMLKTIPPEDVEGRFKAILKMRKPTFRQYWKTYLITNILSAPKTHERNIIGNAVNLAKTPLAMAVGAPFSDELSVGGAGAYIRGAWGQKERDGVAATGIRPALKGFLHIMKHGYAPGAESRFELPPVELFPHWGEKGRAVANVISRGLSGMDYFARELATQGELRSMAHDIARREGLRGDQLADRITELVRDPTPAMLEHADKASTRAVFQEGGQAAQLATSLRDKANVTIHYGAGKKFEIPAGDFILPFIRTPANIFGQGFQLSPLGFLSKTAHSGGRLQAQARAEAALGTMLLAPIAWLAREGRLSGSGPTDPAEQNKLRKLGWEPNSIKVGDHWVGYSVLGPMALPLAVVANLHDDYVERSNRGEKTDLSSAALGASLRLGRTMLQQSYLQNLSDLFDAVSDNTGHRWQNLVARIGASHIPASSLLRATSSAIDPVLRDPQNLEESFKAQLPFLSKEVQPRIRPTGEPITIEPPGGAMGRMFLPMNISRARSDLVTQQLSDLGMTLAMPRAERIEPPPAKTRGMTPAELRRASTLPPREALAVEQAKGYATQHALENLFSKPGWSEKSDVAKRNMIEKTRNRVGHQVMTRAKVLRNRGQPVTLEEIYPRVLGEAPPSEP